MANGVTPQPRVGAPEPKCENYADIEEFLRAHYAWENGADNDWNRVDHEHARRKLGVFVSEWEDRINKDEATTKLNDLYKRIADVPGEAIYQAFDGFLESMKRNIGDLTQRTYETAILGLCPAGVHQRLSVYLRQTATGEWRS